MTELQQIQQQIEDLRRQANAARRRKARAALLAAGADTKGQRPGMRTRKDSRTGMPGLTYIEHESGLIWVVDPPIIDGQPLGERMHYSHQRWGAGALRYAIRKRLSLTPKLPMTEDQWVRIVSTWRRIGPGETFAIERLLKARTLGAIRITTDGIQSTYMRDGAVKSKFITPKAAGSVHLAKLMAWSWLEDEAELVRSAPKRARPGKPTSRASDPDLPRGVCRRVGKDRRSAPVIQYEATVTNANGEWRQKRFVAGRVGVATEAQCEAARAAAIAYRAAWVRATDLGDRTALDMDWSNWRTAFAPESEAESVTEPQIDG